MPTRETIRTPSKFIATLRRVADALERERPVRIQLAGKRLTVPATAAMSIEYEVEDGEAELELQFKWREDGEERAPNSAARATPKKQPRKRKG